MPRLPCKTLFALFILLSGTLSCAHAPVAPPAPDGPLIGVCLSEPSLGGFQCVGADQKSFFLPYSASDHYIAFSPEDESALLVFCKNNMSEREENAKDRKELLVILGNTPQTPEPALKSGPK